MKRLFRSALGLCVALFLAFGSSSIVLAQNQTEILPGVDLPGFDYAVVKDTVLDACQATCEDSRVCRAFTYNEKAGWCFLKSDVGAQEAFSSATSGIVKGSPIPAVTDAVRQAELPFPAESLVDAAKSFAVELKNTDPAPADTDYNTLLNTAREFASSNPTGAMVSYRQALSMVGNDPDVWFELAEIAIERSDAYFQEYNDHDYDLSVLATSAALNGFLRAQSEGERARGLADLAKALEHRDMWREAIAAYRASLAVVEDTDVAERLDKALAEHGFRITSNDVDSEAANPRICVVFSDALPSGDTDLSRYIVVQDAPQVAVEPEQSQVCLEGIEHGKRYNIRVRAGLPSADGETLPKDVDLNVYVPDRSPFVGFANNAYVMPAGLGGGLPITSINAETAEVVIYRIGDRSIATAVRNGIFQNTLTGYSAEDVANQYGEKTFEGEVDLAQGEANAMMTTAVPVQDVMGDIPPGAYVITAKVKDGDAEYWDEMATQWFIVTDLGLTTAEGEDGVHAFVRSLDSAKPLANVDLRLVAVNNEILGEATTDADGRATFAPGLARGEGGRAPQLLVAETSDGDYAFLDLSKSAFDLTDRGVEGRPSPGPLDVFATTERGVYRPGETVFLTALLRDSKAKAVLDLPLTLQLERPDGVVAQTELLSDSGAGGYFAAMPMVSEAMRGAWTIRLYADPKGEALANTTFLVEDFEPERLAFEVTAADAAMPIGEPVTVDVAAKYLYGATAPDLDVEADVVIRPINGLPAFPNYIFGREDDTIETSREPLGIVGTTDAQGNVAAEITLPEPQVTTRPLEAQLLLRLVDTNGRTVERSLVRPVLAQSDRIGIKPTFEGEGLAEGSDATFDVIAVSPEGKTVDKAGLTWTLSRIETNYQWYRSGSTWKWEAITTTREMSNGTVDALASGPVTVGATVRWGEYLFEVDSSGPDATSTSYQFYAGYYYPEAGSDTPDTLSVALDKSAYAIGDTAVVKLDPQFAGTALVMVVDDRIIDMQAVEVPEDGTEVSLKVTENWGPGAYVTAVLYRPSDAAQKRMPARALGLAFADVDPGDMQLDVALDAPKEQLPREPLKVTVDLGTAVAGQKAYVAVAAVDLGILNLTNFKVPDPDGYFFGQRQLGMEFRDLYGQLIDPTQGLPGALRSGGDGGASRFGTPPPTTVLVAQHSGIVEVDATGKATVTFDMPDFAGTVRIMAMAWTAESVGHASADVIVRDPVVVTLSPPRFLRLGDVSRLLVEINNVGGPAGDYEVNLTTSPGLSTDATEQTIPLKAGGRTSLDLSLTGTEIGDQPLTLVVGAPDGTTYTKELVLGVRAVTAPMTMGELKPLAAGDSISLDASHFADLVDGSGSLTLAVGPIARLDIPGLLMQLDRYPYGCAEQLSSRALPLLYLNDVAKMIGMGDDAEIEQRVKDAIINLLAKQSSTGGFGLWGPFDGTDLWLDSYVTDMLLRAKAEGYAVPEDALNQALDNLGNQVSYATDFDNGGEDVAYALYDLAKSGRAAIGDLRYYLEARLDNFGSPLAKAQLGAALALYGDTTRSATAFEAAVSDFKKRYNPARYRTDYGSRLRDIAGVLALAAEFKPAGVDIARLTEMLAEGRDNARYTSTQEDAWTLLAASALAKEAAGGSVTIDGEALTGSVYRRFTDADFANGETVVIANTGDTATEAKLTTSGIPTVPPEASSDGFTIRREYFAPDGTSIGTYLDAVAQNDRFVVVLTMRSTELGSGQYVVADPLPAGFEIENPDLSAGAGVGDLSWLSVDAPVHVESRTDQYVAAFRYVSDTQVFKTAYMVRAVSPGTFVVPGATIEDMYQPERRANTGAASVEIAPAGR